VGKTTVALALMAALRRRGLCVQPFKVGPDFIDPGHHTAVCGRLSRNLDTWMLSEQTVRGIFTRASADADISVIEGVMGLFDGRSADDPRGSTAHLAQLLGAPVLLVVDAEAVAGSIAATVKGFAEFDPAVRVSAVLCNRVAGPRHYAHLEPAIRRHTRVVPVGWLPRRPEWHIPERHLGLVTQQDVGRLGGAIDADQLAATFEASVDIDAVLRIAVGQVFNLSGQVENLAYGGETRYRVAVARDAAFCFYYQENLDLLHNAGAEIVTFSPVHDAALPDGIDLVYLGGGYPELHAAPLAANRSMLDSLRAYHCRGGAIYAECGGLMFCCRELVDVEGRVFPLLDLLPARTIMQKRLAALCYVTWRATIDSLLGPAGTELRGHEFHYSRLESLGPLQPTSLLQRAGEEPRPDGFVQGRLLAGYAHLHFASHPRAVGALLDKTAPDRRPGAAS
jgi:cobyrinic acid a,c-diamide synthase